MAQGQDKYASFAELATAEALASYRVRVRDAGPTLILAPHGGGIEPGTSELAEAIAAGDHSLYVFDALKVSDNAELHITSTNFDEPRCIEALLRAERVLTVHGEGRPSPVVFVGGLETAGVECLQKSLRRSGFRVEPPDREYLEGRARANVCNRGRTGAGVQLEIMEGLRRTFFRNLTPVEERRSQTADFRRFVEAVRTGIADWATDGK